MLRKIAKDKLGILLISDTKVNPSFPSSQFEIVGFSSTFQFDRNTSGGIMLFVQREIRSKLLSKYKPNGSFENIFIEIKLRSKKWFLSYSYNPNLTILNNHTQNIIRSLDFYLSKYENFIVPGDFNAETSNTTFSDFCAICNLKNPIKEPIFETRLSDFLKVTFIVLKAYFQK